MTGHETPLSNIADVAVNQLPVVAAPLAQIARNRNWRGAAIVPGREDREFDAWEKFRTRQLPFLIEQMTAIPVASPTGGLTTDRIARSPFQSSQGEPNLPVTEYYSALGAAEAAHDRARHENRAMTPEQARAYGVLHGVSTAMSTLGKLAKGEIGGTPTPERVRELRQHQIRIARQAMEAVSR